MTGLRVRGDVIEVALGFARRAARAYAETHGPAPAPDALGLSFLLERRLDLLRAHPGFAERGELRPEFRPGREFIEQTEREFTGER